VHPAAGQGPAFRSPHLRVVFAFPKLIEGGRATRKQGGAQQRVRQQGEVETAGRAGIETGQRGVQHQKRQDAP
jgi:hypothetical protein